MPKTALLIVDLQNDYFSSWQDAKWPLVGTEAAAQQTANLLQFFRENTLPVIHVRHEATANAPFFVTETEGSEIHPSVAPIKNESVLVKHHANSFHETNLQQILDAQQITDLVIVGAMIQNCIDHTVRAAVDLGYRCSIADDACATRDLTYQDKTVPAAAVRDAFMAALGFAYAKIDSTANLIASMSQKLAATKNTTANSNLTQFFEKPVDVIASTTSSTDIKATNIQLQK